MRHGAKINVKYLKPILRKDGRKIKSCGICSKALRTEGKTGFCSMCLGRKRRIVYKELFIEVKHSKKYPKEVLVTKTFKEAKDEAKIPLLVFLKLNNSEPLVLCKLKDIKEIAEKLEEKETKYGFDEKDRLVEVSEIDTIANSERGNKK